MGGSRVNGPLWPVPCEWSPCGWSPVNGPRVGGPRVGGSHAGHWSHQSPFLHQGPVTNGNVGPSFAHRKMLFRALECKVLSRLPLEEVGGGRMTGEPRLHSLPPNPTPAPLSHRLLWETMNAGVTLFRISAQTCRALRPNTAPHPMRRGFCIPHFTGSHGGEEGGRPVTSQRGDCGQGGDKPRRGVQVNTAGKRPGRLSLLFTFTDSFSAPSVQGPSACPVLPPLDLFPDDGLLVPSRSAPARTQHTRVRAHRHTRIKNGSVQTGPLLL